MSFKTPLCHQCVQMLRRSFLQLRYLSVGHTGQGQVLSGVKFSQSNLFSSKHTQFVCRRWYSGSTSAASAFKSVHLSHSRLQVNTPLQVSLRNHSHSDSEGERSDSDKEEEEEPEMAKPVIPASLKSSKAEALWGLFVADAISMPVHWYYDQDAIKQDFGHWLTGYEAPKDKHPSSILRLSAVDGSGRGTSTSKDAVVGTVILHDKLKYWTGGSSINHYHQGMKAGDNTLNAITALHVLQTMNRVDHDLIRTDQEVRGSVVEDYVRFMTTPGSHNDTYAESFHRAFFKDWVQSGKPTSADEVLEFAEKRYNEKIKGSPDSQLPHIGGLVAAIPWIIRNAHKSENECSKAAVDFVKLTHPVTSLVVFVDLYARLLHAVLNGSDLKSEVLKVLGNSIIGGPQNRDGILRLLDSAGNVPRGSEKRLHLYQSTVSSLGLACYIEGAFRSLLFLALEFHDDFEGGVLANANCGGENCHRGAALGALLAAAASCRGQEVPKALKEGLHSLKSDISLALTEMNEGF